jgi:hypothetical protein
VILELVAVHEAGHYLGLAHSQVPGSIMGASYDNTGIRAPVSDDLAGICELFPPDGLPDEDEDGCRVTSSPEVRVPWFPFVVLGIFPVILRRFRRRPADFHAGAQPRKRIARQR